MHQARGRNLLGAFVTAVNDRIQWQAEQTIGMAGKAPAALVTIGHNYGESVDFLSRLLQLSHSGCVRLVDKLHQNAWVERRPGKDGRSLSLYLTAKGRERKRQVLRARREAVGTVFEALNEAQQRQFVELLEVMLQAMTCSKFEADVICRLCEEQVCVQSRCPVTIGSIINAAAQGEGRD